MISLLLAIMSLELILGPMFAGKTSALQSIVKRHSALGIKCVVYKPVSDTRYGSDTYMCSHDLTRVKAIAAKNLTNHALMDPYLEAKIVVIEEGQFFEDLYDFVLKAVEKDKKIVVVGGLDGDCFRKPFGQILDLIPLADSITKLTAFCKICADGTPGIFTYRLTESKETIEVGGDEMYMPLCRSHYNEYTALFNSECPMCSSDLVGSVYRPRCSKCPWDLDSETAKGSELLNPYEGLPTIQVTLDTPPTESLLEQTT